MFLAGIFTWMLLARDLSPPRRFYQVIPRGTNRFWNSIPPFSGSAGISWRAERGAEIPSAHR
jgi:hypothetical protein